VNEEIHMPVTLKEARELEKLDAVWDSITTVVGLYHYFRILGESRTRQILQELTEKKQVHMHVIKVMECGRCGIRETIAPISEGEKFALGIDKRYRCFACRTL